MRARLLLLSLALIATPLAAKPKAVPARPVMVAGHDDLDACLSTASVRQLDPRGDGYLSVRAGPGTSARELDRIRSGHVVWDCDASADGKWTGIVYHPQHRTQDDFDCDLGPSTTMRRPYRGNCRSGWVSTRFLQILAG